MSFFKYLAVFSVPGPGDRQFLGFEQNDWYKNRSAKMKLMHDGQIDLCLTFELLKTRCVPDKINTLNFTVRNMFQKGKKGNKLHDFCASEHFFTFRSV